MHTKVFTPIIILLWLTVSCTQNENKNVPQSASQIQITNPEISIENDVPNAPEDIINPDGGMDIFEPENLLDKSAFESVINDENEIGIYVEKNLEGIILKRPEYYFGEYLVLITYTNNQGLDGNLYKGGKAKIDLYDTQDAVSFVGRSGLSWLDGIMVPGRRIKFDVALEGNAPHLFFTRIRSLPFKK